MSEELHVKGEIRDALILKDTLKAMGYDYNELNKGEILEIKRQYHNIMIDCANGTTSCDSADKGMVNKIQQTYMENFLQDQAIKEGNHITKEVKANGDIVLRW